MAISVNWITGVITVPRADMAVIQLSPVEIREHDTNAFRLELRDLEDDVDGRPWPRTHDHNEDVLVGGISLADVLLVLPPYTVTYEDGLYAVYLQGTNNNILERTNKNQVSVNPSNSAGLVSSTAIENMSFNREVCIDENSPYSGTTGEIGTLQKPVNNIPDGLIIANYRGFEKFHVHGNLTIGAGHDVSGFTFEGHSSEKTVITIEDVAVTVGCEFEKCEINGILDGSAIIENCKVASLLYVSGEIRRSRIKGPVTLGGNKDALLTDCCADEPAVPAVIDMGGSGQNIFLADWSGAVKFQNMTGANKIGVQIDGGKVYLEPTISAGFIGIVGIGEKVDNSTGTAVVNIDGLLNKEATADAVWNVELKDYQNDDTPGYALTQLLYNDTVFIDPVGGNDGTAYPKGLRGAAVKTLAAALALINTYELSKVHVLGDLTISGGEDIGGLTFLSDRSIGNSVTVTSADTAETYFENLTVSGTMNGTVRYTYCVLGAITAFTGGAKNSLQTSSISLGAANNYLTDLDTYRTLADGYQTINVYGHPLNVIRCQGNYEIANKTGANTIFINLVGGKVRIDATCTAGTIVIDGIGSVIDNSAAGCTVNYDDLVSPDNISNQTWDEQKLDHVITGSTGEALNDLHNEAMCTWKLDPTAKTLTYYRADDTVLKVFNLTSTGAAVPAFIERIA